MPNNLCNSEKARRNYNEISFYITWAKVFKCVKSNVEKDMERQELLRPCWRMCEVV